MRHNGFVRLELTLLLAIGISPAKALAASTHVLEVRGATLQVIFTAGSFAVPDSDVLGWVESSARATAAYFDGFPVKRAAIRISAERGRDIHGTTYPSHEIDIRLGRQASRGDLAADWVLTHEMVHLGFPSVPPRQHWMEEGLATYVEPLARVRTGGLSPEKVWGDLVHGLPNGLPEPGDRGLDFTPTWGRTYWGGALFFLLADIDIRERTGNRKGLEHALRGIVAAGGTIDADWNADRVIAAGDRATGVPVLRELYDRMKDRPAPVDLDVLWKRLGVALHDGRITFDDAAPLAAVRRAITTG